MRAAAHAPWRVPERWKWLAQARDLPSPIGCSCNGQADLLRQAIDGSAAIRHMRPHSGPLGIAVFHRAQA